MDELVFHGAIQESPLSVCGDGWFNQCTLITQCTTGVHLTQPQSPISLGQVRLL